MRRRLQDIAVALVILALAGLALDAGFTVEMGAAPASATGTATPVRDPNIGCHVRGALPDPACTPGAVLTTDRATVCASGYAGTVRAVSTATKDAVYARYGISDHTDYVIDHLVGLENGGSNDPANLWPQRVNGWPGAGEKDLVEGALHRAVCDGRVSLPDAQRWLETDWRMALLEPAVQG